MRQRNPNQPNFVNVRLAAKKGTRLGGAPIMLSVRDPELPIEPFEFGLGHGRESTTGRKNRGLCFMQRRDIATQTRHAARHGVGPAELVEGKRRNEASRSI